MGRSLRDQTSLGQPLNQPGPLLQGHLWVLTLLCGSSGDHLKDLGQVEPGEGQPTDLQGDDIEGEIVGLPRHQG
jgi:hypothetical protein